MNAFWICLSGCGLWLLLFSVFFVLAVRGAMPEPPEWIE